MIFYALPSAEIVQPCSDLPSFVVPEKQALRSKGQGHFFVILASYLRCQFEGFLLGILFISQICPDLRFEQVSHVYSYAMYVGDIPTFQWNCSDTSGAPESGESVCKLIKASVPYSTS
jgi:hypothetical protein